MWAKEKEEYAQEKERWKMEDSREIGDTKTNEKNLMWQNVNIGNKYLLYSLRPAFHYSEVKNFHI